MNRLPITDLLVKYHRTIDSKRIYDTLRCKLLLKQLQEPMRHFEHGLEALKARRNYMRIDREHVKLYCELRARYEMMLGREPTSEEFDEFLVS